MKRKGFKMRLISCLLAVLLLTASVVPASAESIPFEDVPANKWYAPAVEYCYTRGLMSGNSAAEFSPDQPVTRAMMIQVLYNVKARSLSPLFERDLPFKDVPKTAWYTKAVIWGYSLGITSGTSDTAFSPNATITREQVATMFYNLHGLNYLLGGGMDVSIGKAYKFSDYKAISSYARAPMAWAINSGLLSGVGYNKLDPKGTATRAQLAQILMNYTSRMGQDAATPVPTEKEVNKIMLSFKNEYYEGRRWTDADYYDWNGGVFMYGTGCVAFAMILSDAAFGNLPARVVSPVKFKDVRVGDILRVNYNSHSVIVLEVKSNSVVVAEGNYNGTIHWGRTLSKAEVESANYRMTRYPQ